MTPSEQRRRKARPSNPGATLRRAPTQARGAATVNAITAAAVEILQQEGRDRFSITDVAARAGVAIGTVYRYFRTREDVLDHIWPNRTDTFLDKDFTPPRIEPDVAP